MLSVRFGGAAKAFLAENEYGLAIKELLGASVLSIASMLTARVKTAR